MELIQLIKQRLESKRFANLLKSIQDPDYISQPLSSRESETHSSNNQYGGNQNSSKQVTDLKEQIEHLRIVNSKLMPDLERQESEIYDLRDQLEALQTELQEKKRECYHLSNQLIEAHDKIQM